MSAKDPRRALALRPPRSLRAALRGPAGLAAGLRRALARAIAARAPLGPAPAPGAGRPVRLQLEPALRAALAARAAAAGLPEDETALRLLAALGPGHEA